MYIYVFVCIKEEGEREREITIDIHFILVKTSVKKENDNSLNTRSFRQDDRLGNRSSRTVVRNLFHSIYDNLRGHVQ